MNYINRYIYTIFFLCVSISFFSCQRSDMSSAMLLAKAEHLMTVSPDSSLYILKDSINNKELSKKEYADWCLLITQAIDKNYIQHSTDSLIRLATEYYEKDNNPDRLMLSYYYMGRVAHDFGDAPRAQEYYLRAYTICEKTNNLALLGRICSNLGILYLYQDVYSMAIPYLQEAVNSFEDNQESESKALVLRDLGRVYGISNQLDSAIYYYEKALQITNLIDRSLILSEFGGIYIRKGEYENAKKYLYSALEYIYEGEDYTPLYLTLGNYFYHINKNDSAVFYLNKCIDSPFLETKASAYYYLYHIAKDEGHWSDYAFLQSRHEEISAIIASQTHTGLIARMQSVYNYERFEKESFAYKLQHAISQRNNLILLSGITLLSFFITGLFLYYHHIRTEQKKQRSFLFQQLNKKEFSISSAQIAINKKRIGELEQQKNNNSWKDSIVLAQEILLCMNSWILHNLEQNKEADINLKQEEIYRKLHNRETKNMGEDDWNTLIETIDYLYPDFPIKIRITEITHEDIQIAYLLKLDLKPVDIARLISRQPNAVSMRQKRLAKRLLNEKADNQKLYDYIKSL